MSLLEKLIVAAVLAFLAAGAIWAGVDHIGDVREAKVRAELLEAAQAQTDRNRDLQRAAELRYTVAAEPRDRFIVKTVREIRHDTENLAACVLTPGAVRRLHDAAACARGDSAAACGLGEPVPLAR